MFLSISILLDTLLYKDFSFMPIDQLAYYCDITIFTPTSLPFLTSLSLTSFDVDVIIQHCCLLMSLDKGNTPKLVGE